MSHAKHTILVNSLAPIIEVHAKAGVPLFTQGTYGVGKSQIHEQAARKLAEGTGREFVAWAKAGLSKQADVRANPGKYFVFIDIRLALLNETELRGLLLLSATEQGSLTLACPPFAAVITHPDAAGVILFDEINLAPQTIAGMAYQFIHDRIISDRPVAAGVSIFAAGNFAEDAPEMVQDLPAPLMDRLSEVAIESTTDTFLNYIYGRTPGGLSKEIVTIRKRDDEEIAAFKGMRSEVLLIAERNKVFDTKYRESHATEKSVTPRGCERVSKLLDAMPEQISLQVLSDTLKAAIGASFANDLIGHIKFRSVINFADFLANPGAWVAKSKAPGGDRNIVFQLAEIAATECPAALKDKAQVAIFTNITDAIGLLPADAIALFVSMLNVKTGGREQAMNLWKNALTGNHVRAEGVLDALDTLGKIRAGKAA